MSAGNQRIVQVFSALALAFGGAGGYLALRQRSTTGVSADHLVVRPPQPPPATAPPAASREADVHPLILPPSMQRGKRAGDAVVSPQEQAQLMAKCTEAATLGVPSGGGGPSSEVRCYGGYLSSLNYERRIPNWVLEAVECVKKDPSAAKHKGSTTAEDDGEEVSRKRSAFYADPTVPEPFRVAANDYEGVHGLSRGHLAPAQLHKGSQAEMDATFNMNANIVPQDMTCNAMDWLRVESLVRKLRREVGTGTSAEQGRLYVVTGPAFLPRTVRVERRAADGQVAEVALKPSDTPSGPAFKKVVEYEVVGKSGVAVPTHLFKVILAETRPVGSGAAGKTPRYEVAAFLVPNEPLPVEKPLTAYQVNPSELERITGLTLFPRLLGRQAAGSSGGGVSLASLPNLCKSHKCETRSAALFEKYRLVAQLRSASTIPELRRTYAALEANAKAKAQPLDEAIRQEFQKRTEILVAQAVGPIE